MNWLHTVWFGYGWPSLQGNGPEALIELVLLAVLGRIFWPRIKRFLHKEDAALHRKMEENKRLLCHIIDHHPDIPPLPKEKP